jgi:hypothetical protein
MIDIWYVVCIVLWAISLAHTRPLTVRVSFMCAHSWNLSIFCPIAGPMSFPCVAVCAVRSHSIIMLLHRAQLSASTIICYRHVVVALRGTCNLQRFAAHIVDLRFLPCYKAAACDSIVLCASLFSLNIALSIPEIGL